jgi:hypothetical protein
MKPAQARIADFWCKLMHTEPMWPSHGQYQCRECGRRHRVGWDEPLLPGTALPGVGVRSARSKRLGDGD